MPPAQNSEAIIKSLIQSQSQLVANMSASIEYFGSLTTASAKLTDAFGGLASVIGQVGTVHRALGEMFKGLSGSLGGFSETLSKLSKWKGFIETDKLKRDFLGFGDQLKKIGLKGADPLDKLSKMASSPAVSQLFRALGIEAVQLSGHFAKMVAGAAGIIDKFGALSLASLAVGERLIAAASPDLAATLSGSLNLLAGQIGSILMPAFVDMIAGLQSLARWVRELSPGMKALVVDGFQALAALAGLRIAFAGVAFILGPVVSSFRILVPAVISAASRMSLFSSIAGAAALGLLLFTGALEREADRLDDYNNRDNRWTEMELKHESELKKKADQIKDPEERIKFLQAEERRRREAEEKAIKEERTPNPGSFWGKAKESIVPGERSPRDMDLDRLSRLERERLEASQLLESERRKQQGLQPVFPTPRRDRQQKGLLLDLVTQNQPQYNQIAEVYRKIQLSALGGSELDQAQKAMHRQQMEELLKQSRLLESIDKKIGRNGFLV